MSATYSADDLINKTFYAKKKVNGYSLADINSDPIFTFNPGAMIGVVFSYVIKPDGLYWMFKYNNRPYYLKHELNTFNLQDLKKQGLISTEEKAEIEKEANKSNFDKIFDFGKKGITTVAIVLLGIYAYKNLK